MKWFLCFCIIFHLHLNDASQILNRQKRVVGGYYTPNGMFPYVASLRVNKYGYFMHFCGGAIISQKYILSSAHCMIFQDQTELECYKGRYVDHENLKYDIIAVVGTNILNDEEQGDTYEIHSFMFHDEFDYKTGANDISLLLTKMDIKYSKFVQPITIYENDLPPESTVVVPGWGLTSFPGEPSNRLKHISLTVITIEECEESWSKIYPGQICTYGGKGEGVCTSDSGGPLVYKGDLVGLVSYGKPCAVGFPDVFTNATYMIPWITMNMRCMDGQDIYGTEEDDSYWTTI